MNSFKAECGKAFIALAVAAFAAAAQPLAAAEQRETPVDEDRADDAFGNKQFVWAFHLAPRQNILLQGIDAPSISDLIAWRDKSGTRGTSRLFQYSDVLSATAVSDEDIFTVRVHFLRLESGTPAPDEDIGSLEPPIVRPTTRLSAGIEPVLAWRREAEWAPFIEIGSTPLNGVVNPTVQGRAGATAHLGETSLTGSLYRQSKTESILAYTGIVDPSTGRGFGRVVENGFKLELEQPLFPNWTLDAQASIGDITGDQVARNNRYSITLEPSYEIAAEGLDSLTLGPAAEFEHFDRNLSAFTLGSGGYFSPQMYQKLGANLNFQTSEARSFLFQGSVFAGWERSSEHSAPVFPLDDNGDRYPATRQNGFSMTGELSVVYQLTDRWSLGGNLQFQQSPEFNDLWIGISLKFNFSPRRALVSTDLPVLPSQ